ncbi:DUF418 domain-containing protein [Cytobacillus purgationiresistens]
MLLGTLLVIVLFFIQILLSRLWVKYFYYGPIEWCWRSFTYM